MSAKVDFFFNFGSTYSYLSVQRAEALAEREGVVLNWRPFSVRTLMREQNNSPFVGKPAKMAYMWRDIERRAEQLRLPFSGAPPYPIDADELANRVATLAAIEGWCAEFSQAAYRLWFTRKQNPGDVATLSDLLTDLGHDAEAVLARANSETVRARYAAETDTGPDHGEDEAEHDGGDGHAAPGEAAAAAADADEAGNAEDGGDDARAWNEAEQGEDEPHDGEDADTLWSVEDGGVVTEIKVGGCHGQSIRQMGRGMPPCGF